MIKESDLKSEDLIRVHQIVWLMNEFPGETINEFAKNFLAPEMPIYHVNLTIWQARDLGYIVIDDPEFDGSGTYKVDRVPDEWHFGAKTEELLETLPYFLKQLNAEESDIAEGQLQSWMIPFYTRYEYGIALRKLTNDNVVATYEIKVVHRKGAGNKGRKRGKEDKIFEDKYVYYTLPENLEQKWGKKQHPDQSILE